LRNQLMTLLFAGHETTASALGWTWALLSEHPDAAARVENEATRVLATGPPSGAALMELRYTEQCLMESMRIYPPGWMLDRVALADDVLGGFRVPAGTLLLLSPYVTQRSAAYWPDPLRFDPDRFGGAGVAGLPRFTYFPFGGGPRRCIGMEFAITQAKLIIARISRRYRLRLVPGHVVGAEPSVTLRAKHGVRMTIEARDGA
jgi:cytochrome P450